MYCVVNRLAKDYFFSMSQGRRVIRELTKSAKDFIRKKFIGRESVVFSILCSNEGRLVTMRMTCGILLVYFLLVLT